MGGDVAQERATKGDQPLAGGRSRPERCGPANERLLKLAFAGLEHGQGERGSTAEAPEQRSLADAGLGGDCVHRRAGDAVAREQPLGGAQDSPAVAGGVGALFSRPDLRKWQGGVHNRNSIAKSGP